MPDDPRYRPDRGRALLTGLAIADVVLAVPLLAKGFSELREQPGVDHVALQFAGGREAACRVIQPGATGCPVSEADRAPEIARASDLDPGTTARPDIILPPAVADASTATLSATVGQSGPDVQRELYPDEGRTRAAREAASVGGHPDPDLPGPAQARWHNVLPRARYLVSVSGGGYMTGAFQLALTRANPEAESLATWPPTAPTHRARRLHGARTSQDYRARQLHGTRPPSGEPRRPPNARTRAEHLTPRYTWA